MGRKNFVSYKYVNSSVQNLNYYSNSTVRNYVDYLENLLGRNNIYKGKHDGEDLSKCSLNGYNLMMLKNRIIINIKMVKGSLIMM